MIRYEYLDFLKDWQDIFPENLQFVISLQNGNWLIARNYIFEVVGIDNPVLREYSDIEVVDGNNNHFIIGNYVDEYLEVGRKILVPMAFTSYRGVLSPRTPVGYTLARDDCELSKVFTYDEYVPATQYIHPLHNRGGFIITDPEGLPDIFWNEFTDMLHLKPKVPNTIQEYIDNIKLLDYNAKYSLFDELENELVKEQNDYNRKPQTFDSRQSKVYIMSKDMKQILKKTSVMLVNHKAKQFGIDALELRQLENKKLFSLLKDMGLNKDEVGFARKEVGSIRAVIDTDNAIIVKARFVEINIDDHQDKSSIRYLQNGEQIDIDDKGNWYFLNEL